MKTYTKYLILTAILAPFSNATITWGSNCDATAKTKVVAALKDASRMASTVYSGWDTDNVKEHLKGYFSGVTGAKKDNIRTVMDRIRRVNTLNLEIHCVKDYSNNVVPGHPGQSCSNREVGFVIHESNIITFCPPFFSDQINSFLETTSAEICATKPGVLQLHENPLSTYKAVSTTTGMDTNYAAMIEWVAHRYPGKWALHELTHTLVVGDVITSQTPDSGRFGAMDKQGTTDVEGPDGNIAYGKTKAKKLTGDKAYWNADNYAWLAWSSYRDACISNNQQPAGQACDLVLRRRTVTGKGGKKKVVTSTKCKPRTSGTNPNTNTRPQPRPLTGPRRQGTVQQIKTSKKAADKKAAVKKAAVKKAAVKKAAVKKTGAKI